AELHRSTESNFIPNGVTYLDRVYGKGVYTDADVQYGIAYFYRLVSVDRGGLRSDPSTQISLEPQPLVDADLIATTIDSRFSELTDNVLPALTTKVDTSLRSYVVQYAVNSSETVAPTTGWSTTPPTRNPGTFIWHRT